MADITAVAPVRTGRGILLSTLAGGVVASIVNIVIGLAARAAGADPSQSGMMIGSEIFLSIAGVFGGAIGWAVVRRVSRRPGRALAVLVPIVFLVTLIPDLGVGISSGTAAIWTAVVGLMLMHVATVAVAIPVYLRFLPLDR